MLRALSAGLFLALSLAQVRVQAAESNTEAPDPRALGRVVILPFLDSTEGRPAAGEQREQDADKQRAAVEFCRELAHFEVEARFRMYGIEYVRRPELAGALAAVKLVPTREADRARAKLKALADHLKARYVVSGIISDANSDWRRRGVLGEGKADATVQLQVYDAREGRSVEYWELTAAGAARGKTLSSRSFSRTQQRRAKAVRDATQKALAAFLRPYPLLYEEDPGEAFVVYPSRRETEPNSAPASTAGATSTAATFPTKPVVFKLKGGTVVEGTIQKFEDGFYTVMTAEGKVTVAQEQIITVTEK